MGQKTTPVNGSETPHIRIKGKDRRNKAPTTTSSKVATVGTKNSGAAASSGRESLSQNQDLEELYPNSAQKMRDLYPEIRPSVIQKVLEAGREVDGEEVTDDELAQVLHVKSDQETPGLWYDTVPRELRELRITKKNAPRFEKFKAAYPNNGHSDKAAVLLAKILDSAVDSEREFEAIMAGLDRMLASRRRPQFMPGMYNFLDRRQYMKNWAEGGERRDPVPPSGGEGEYGFSDDRFEKFVDGYPKPVNLQQAADHFQKNILDAPDPEGEYRKLVEGFERMKRTTPAKFAPPLDAFIGRKRYLEKWGEPEYGGDESDDPDCLEGHEEQDRFGGVKGRGPWSLNWTTEEAEAWEKKHE